MIADAQLMFSDAQAVTADAASTNVIDLGVARQLGSGEPLGIVLTVDVAADFTTTDETYIVRVDSDDNSAFTSATTVSTNTITAATLTAGKQIVIPFVPGVNVEQYIRLYYDVGGTTPTITVTAFLQPLSMISTPYYYNDAITIS